MKRREWRKILVIAAGACLLILLILGVAGATLGREFLQMVGRDKDLIKRSIEAAHSKESKPSTDMETIAKQMELKQGRFQSVNKILGVANLEDGLSGKHEYSYHAYCQFERGEVTYVFRIGNETDAPKVLAVEAFEGHKSRKRVRQVLADHFPAIKR